MANAGWVAEFLQLFPAQSGITGHFVSDDSKFNLELSMPGPWELKGRSPRGNRILELKLPPAFMIVGDQFGSGDAMRVTIPPQTEYRIIGSSGTLHVQLDTGSEINPIENAIDLQAWPRHDIVRRACEFIERNLNEPIVISELAVSIGVSVRTLERAFAVVCGISPSRYILARRLNAAYRDLLKGKPGRDTVTETAHNSGLNHLGRFSVQYREWFDESPITTLKTAPEVD